MTDNFEARLIEALQPIRGLALANAIHHLFQSGIYDSISTTPIDVAHLAADLKLDSQRIEGFLRYLANEDIVALHDGLVTLTTKGEQFRPFRPWYELFVGGYASTFQEISANLKGTVYASRNDRLVGVGSCGISMHDALPLVRNLLSSLSAKPTCIIDLGCGDGTFLTSLVETYGTASGVGVDSFAPIQSSVESVTFLRCSATEYIHSQARADTNNDHAGKVFLAAFLLQEILEQEGRQAVVELVRGVLSQAAHFAVVEVDHRPTDPSVMRHGLGLSYYNPYYLLHVITEQRLETEQFWLELFMEAGAKVVSKHKVNPQVDSTGLEVGFLLAPMR